MTHAPKLILLLAAAVMGCTSRVCTLDSRMGLFVVIEQTSPENLVTVVAASGDYSEHLHCSYDDGSHQCQGLQERPGTYVITVAVNGISEEQTVILEQDECHVLPQTITFGKSGPASP